MNKSFFTSSLVSISILLMVPNPVLAWDDFGHMAVAGIAYKRLNPDVRKRADQLVKLNPSCSTWLSTFRSDLTESEKNMMLFQRF